MDEKGNPRANVSVVAAGSGRATNAMTDAAGAYRLSHLASGLVAISVFDPKKESVAPAQTNIASVEGKTITVPNFVVNEGAIVETAFLDEDTGKPILECPCL